MLPDLRRKVGRIADLGARKIQQKWRLHDRHFDNLKFRIDVEQLGYRESENIFNTQEIEFFVRLAFPLKRVPVAVDFERGFPDCRLAFGDKNDTVYPVAELRMFVNCELMFLGVSLGELEQRSIHDFINWLCGTFRKRGNATDRQRLRACHRANGSRLPAPQSSHRSSAGTGQSFPSGGRKQEPVGYFSA